MPTRIPAATYRLQLTSHFGFTAVLALVDYFEALGVTHLYLSPIFTSMPGSTHGYDIIDHRRLNPELGSEEEFACLARRLHERGMGLIIDVVPNHMCIHSPSNSYFYDVLENGASSQYAQYFDIDWQPPKPDLTAKVLLPVLGDQYGRVLEAGEIQIRYKDGAFIASYYDLQLPVAPRSWPHILEPALAALQSEFSVSATEVLELESIVTALTHLPLRTEANLTKVRERYREKTIIKRRLLALTKTYGAVGAAIERSVIDLNGQKGEPRSFDRLEMLLADQGYRLSYWRVAADEINYRRFFDINELAAIRVELPQVFAATHELVFRFAKAHLIDGLRIDHVDGLSNPARYLADLCRGITEAQRESDRSEPAGSAAEKPPCFLVVEKILDPGERQPDWPIHGTTGYEFLNALAGLFLEPTGVAALRETYALFTGTNRPFSEVLYESKQLVLRAAMSAELTVLSRKLDRISEQHRDTRDFTLISLKEALAELIACFPVYRTYVRPEDGWVGDDDRRHIDQAVRYARQKNPTTDVSIFDFLKSLLLLAAPGGLSAAEREERSDFVRRFQQLTGPVMAKGMEDTACYRVFPLAGQNEVGSRPESATISPADFHRFNEERLGRTPHGLSSTSTHDTKRSEDVRARLAVLSECPEEFAAAITRWREDNARHRQTVAGAEVPDANEEYLLYQTLLGAWPEGGPAGEPNFISRIKRYMEKALREAKLHTSWITPHVEYEAAVSRFIEALLDPLRSPVFLADLERFYRGIAPAGYWNSLSQVMLKLISPGVPDFYQGCEDWNLSLVDPDNRRPVDFARSRRRLTELYSGLGGSAVALADQLMQEPEDGRVKLYVTQRGLAFRKNHYELFTKGRYLPVEILGAKRDHVIAIARVLEDQAVLAVAGRLYLRLKGTPGQRPTGASAWQDTYLALSMPFCPRPLHEALTDRGLRPVEANGRFLLKVSDVLAHLPVALIEGAA